jgi:hypothetical protein
MRYCMSARVIPEMAAALEQALVDGTFGKGFPFGDLGDNLREECNVGADGRVRWIETCYCREYSNVAMVMELEYFEPFMHAIEIADARDPRYCKGYPHCNDCLCTKTIKFSGTPLAEYLAKAKSEPIEPGAEELLPTRWMGWRGKVQTEEEKNRNSHLNANQY